MDIEAYLKAGSASLIRHAMTAAGGWIAAHGWGSPDLTNALIGVGLAALAVVWGQVDKVVTRA
jgi:hypothetical protein